MANPVLLSREDYLRAWADLCWRFGAEEVVSWLDRCSVVEGGSTVKVPKSIFCETLADAVMIAEVVGRPVYCEVQKRILRVQPSGVHEDVTEKIVRVATLLREDPRQEDFTKRKEGTK